MRKTFKVSYFFHVPYFPSGLCVCVLTFHFIYGPVIGLWSDCLWFCLQLLVCCVCVCPDLILRLNGRVFWVSRHVWVSSSNHLQKLLQYKKKDPFFHLNSTRSFFTCTFALLYWRFVTSPVHLKANPRYCLCSPSHTAILSQPSHSAHSLNQTLTWAIH